MTTYLLRRGPQSAIFSSIAVAAAVWTASSITLVEAREIPAPPQTNAAVAGNEIPATLVAPRVIPFADRVTGRHLLFDGHDVYQNAPTVSFQTHWTSVSTVGPGTPPVVTSGTESVSAEIAARRFALTTETLNPSGERTVRRAVADGSQLTASLFREQKEAKSPTREVIHLPLDEGVSVPRALQQVQVNPVTRAAVLLLDPNFGVRGNTVLWHAGAASINGVRVQWVDEVEASETNDGTERRRARRYGFDPTTHRLLRYEEWMTTKNPDRVRPARKNQPADDGVRVTYRREEYSPVVLTKNALPAATYAAAFPATYLEKPLPAVTLPPLPAPPAPDAYDSRAVALLSRWRSASDRCYTLGSTVTVELRGMGDDGLAVALPDNLRGLKLSYQVSLRKPDQARILMNTISGGNGANTGVNRGNGGNRRGQQFPASMLAVSDGEQVRVIEDGNTLRTVPLNRDNAVWPALNRAGLRDRYGALTYLFTDPPRAADWDKATYEGTATLENGEAVEVVTLSRQTSGVAFRRRQQQQTDTETFLRVSLGRDGLPRMIEVQRVTANANGTDGGRPSFVTVCRYRNVVTDAEPNASAFVLPTARATAAANR